MNMVKNVCVLALFMLVYGGVAFSQESVDAQSSPQQFSVCGLNVGMKETDLPSTLHKVIAEGEGGFETFYSGEICEGSMSARADISDGHVDRVIISRPDVYFCLSDICYGDTLVEVLEAKPELTPIISPVEGGFVSIEDSNGIIYSFDIGNLDFECLTGRQDCRSEIDALTLDAFVIVGQ